MKRAANSDAEMMRLALRLARRGYGATSPNPMVGAVLVKNGKIIGRGWHRRAGLPHAEIEALRDAERRGNRPEGATLYVTLEPCSTHGRTPPCSEAIIAAGIKRVVVGAIDPNPAHAGEGLRILKRARIDVLSCKSTYQEIAQDCTRLNEAFNHWIVHRTPFVTVKAGMTLDGKIATASGESRWISSLTSREFAMHLRQGSDAILAGVNTILADNPRLTVRLGGELRGMNKKRADQESDAPKQLRRIIMDSMARTPLKSNVASDAFAALTTVVVSRHAPKQRVVALAKRVRVLIAPAKTLKNAPTMIDLRWLMKKLGAENVTSLLVEGGGEVNGAFLEAGLAHRIAFFYGPKIIGGRNARKAVAGQGVQSFDEIIALRDLEWRKIGPDLLLTARVALREAHLKTPLDAPSFQP
ncbi:MAG TPA: bifunctional diaminohydroxyphosphoribosylaminopyrimidine deaminase/5-amino-6-(5-phosphoribosylamino)uracil reductase RibD [Candidatus Angelobacter sp.]|nr:bifunctional diaminohydroxyphosphoribosylaminopyrimidine deaminase/5-amino-6-(5-phosphoribosylamino)uracil reductase RibD [Candidatus Angelobacter sp.]